MIAAVTIRCMKRHITRITICLLLGVVVRVATGLLHASFIEARPGVVLRPRFVWDDPFCLSFAFLPFWLEVIAQVLLHSVLWWMLFDSVSVLVRRRRRRAGRCVECGYDLGGCRPGARACPECGTGRYKKETQQRPECRSGQHDSHG